MADYTSKFTGEQIDALLKQGVPIYDDMSKLLQDVPVGSLAAVAVPGTIKESSFRDLYQPDASILDQSTGTITTPELLSQVSSIKVTAPEGNIEGVDSIVYLIPRDFSPSNQKIIAIGIQASNNIVKSVAANIMVGSGSNLALILYNDVVPTVDNSAIETINNYLASGDWCYLGSPEGGFIITEEQFATLDKFIHPVAGISSTAEIYIKKDKWEQLYAKDLQKLDANIQSINDNKADIIPISSYRIYKPVKPNVYTRGNFSTSGTISIYLDDIVDATVYNEFILELNIKTTPQALVFKASDESVVNIKWANGIAPTFEAGFTYLISIANNFGVFAKYINS